MALKVQKYFKMVCPACYAEETVIFERMPTYFQAVIIPYNCKGCKSRFMISGEKHKGLAPHQIAIKPILKELSDDAKELIKAKEKAKAEAALNKSADALNKKAKDDARTTEDKNLA